MVPVFLDALASVAEGLGVDVRLHVVDGSERWLPGDCLERRVVVTRAAGPSDEPFVSTIDESELATEWEWERVAGAHPRRDDRCGRRRRSLQPLQPPLHHVGDHVRRRRSSNAATARSTPRSPATASPVGSTGSTRSIDRNSASPTGRAAACSGAARSCRATACSPSGTSRASTTPPCTADRRRQPDLIRPSWPTRRGRRASLEQMTMLPPPDPATFRPPVVTIRPTFVPPQPPAPTLPVRAAVGAIVVLTVSLIASKVVLDALLDLEWPLLVYVVILAPSDTARRWRGAGTSAGTGGPEPRHRHRPRTPRWSDLGWGPLIWLAALGAQIAMAALVVGLGVPISNNTDGITDLQADRTYIVSIVITAVIAAPIVEEMVFRGVVLRGLRSRMGAVVGDRSPRRAVRVRPPRPGARPGQPRPGDGAVGGRHRVRRGGGALRRIGPTIVAHAIFNGVVLLIVLTGVVDDPTPVLATPMRSAVGLRREQVAVVDQAHVTERRPRPPTGAARSASERRRVGRPARAILGVEHRDVVDDRRRFVGEHCPRAASITAVACRSPSAAERTAASRARAPQWRRAGRRSSSRVLRLDRASPSGSRTVGRRRRRRRGRGRRPCAARSPVAGSPSRRTRRRRDVRR